MNATIVQNKETFYTEDENVIGTWIDGKPIYRKIIKYSGKIPRGESLKVPHGIKNIDFIVNSRILCKRVNSDSIYVFPFLASEGGGQLHYLL